MKKLFFLPLIFLLLETGCVVTPDAAFVGDPIDGSDVEVGFFPRVHTSSSSAVSIWLHPSYVVADAYPLAQNHCSRWGLYARPSYDWVSSARNPRYLNYRCVSYRPRLARRHTFGRTYYSNRHRGRKYRHRRNRVYTPKPLPRVEPPHRKRRTFGRVRRGPKENTRQRRSTVIERGKPWEHNKNKKNINGNSSSRTETVIERGKPWEHNRNKKKRSYLRTDGENLNKELKRPLKRSTFGSSNSIIQKKKAWSVKRKYSNLKKKKESVKKGTLSL